MKHPPSTVSLIAGPPKCGKTKWILNNEIQFDLSNIIVVQDKSVATFIDDHQNLLCRPSSQQNVNPNPKLILKKGMQVLAYQEFSKIKTLADDYKKIFFTDIYNIDRYSLVDIKPIISLMKLAFDTKAHVIGEITLFGANDLESYMDLIKSLSANAEQECKTIPTAKDSNEMLIFSTSAVDFVDGILEIVDLDALEKGVQRPVLTPQESRNSNYAFH